MSTTHTDDRDPSALRKTIDRIDTWLNTASDNGIFQNQDSVKFDAVQNQLVAARKALDENKLSDAESKITEAISTYDAALYAASKWWRFTNLYAGHIWILLVGFLAAIFVFYLSGTYSLLQTISYGGYQPFDVAAIHATTWGAIGSILRGMWWLKKNVNDRGYRNSWTIYFISTPFLGGIFGAIVYVIIVGGLLSITQSDLSIRNSLVIIPFAALAGFNWEWAISIFRKIEDLIVVEKQSSGKAG